MENTDYYYDIVSGTWRAQQMIEQAVQEVKKEYKRTVRKVDEAYAARLFENFIRSLKN
jgi:hydrogenase maturation factor